MRALTIGLVSALALGVAACGGSGNGDAGDEAALVRDCVGGDSGQHIVPAASSLADVAQEAKATLCRDAVGRGFFRDGSLDREEVLSVIRADPAAIDPLCAEAAAVGFRRAPATARASIGMTPSEYGHELCRALTSGDYFDADISIPASSWSRMLQDHPELFGPFMVAGFMDSYDASLGISRTTFRKIVEQAVDEALRSGVITSSGFGDYSIDHEAFKTLLRKAAAQYSK